MRTNVDILNAIQNEKNNYACNFDKKTCSVIIWNHYEKGLPSNQKNVSYRNLKFKFVNFKPHFAQLRRKITGYADLLMMRINLLMHGLIQKFTKETVFCNSYWFCTDTSLDGKKSKNE